MAERDRPVPAKINLARLLNVGIKHAVDRRR